METPKDVEEAVNILVNRIRKAQQTAMVSQPVQILRRGDLLLRFREKMQQKRRLHKLWTHTRCPRLRKKLNELARRLAVAVRDHRGAAWEETIDHASESMKNLHQLNCRLTKTTTPICPITNRAGARSYDVPARAEAIVQYLEGPFSPKSPAISTMMQEHGTLRACGREGPGPDGIATEALRQLPKRVMVAMNKVFNWILRTGHFPEAWKSPIEAITIPKPGKIL
ncbi:RNA-directed DNA polymerase from mobile element jockey [Eumeta japonica]|uniref:RNA-directed DNA polymerase from mobile element jockey n=1 Tax=Eumeta variegata TaxID=151549 RepID=A0A4C1SH79_EUMVA|nr:RNA-directed DNA polymerase from mobile element jockey [Eumeta japonica]